MMSMALFLLLRIQMRKRAGKRRAKTRLYRIEKM